MKANTNPQMLTSIEGIYEWVDSGSNQNQVLESTAKLLASPMAALLQLSLIDTDHVLLAAKGLTPEMTSGLLESIDADGNFLTHYRGWDQGNVYDSKRLLPVVGLTHNDQLGQLIDEIDLQRAIAGVITRKPTSCIIACYYRGTGDQLYNEEDLANLAALLSHWRRAIGLKNRLTSLDRHTQATHRILDHAPFSIMLIDAAAYVLYQNYMARVSGQNNDGLTVRDGRLHLGSADGRKELFNLLRSADENRRAENSGVPNMMAVERASGSRPFQLMILPVQSATEGGLATGPTYAVFIYDPTVNLPVDTNSLCKLEGLTLAEANLCESLYKTKNLSETAEWLDVSISTAKTHLLNTFRKLGINSQAELMKYLAHMPKISRDTRH